MPIGGEEMATIGQVEVDFPRTPGGFNAGGTRGEAAGEGWGDLLLHSL